MVQQTVPLLCCLLTPTLNFGFLHIAVVPDVPVYDCNGSRAGVYDRTSTDRCASQTGFSQLYDGYVLFSRQPPRTAGRRLTARSGHTVGWKIAVPMTGFKVQQSLPDVRSR
jgi:hypothetical protein